MSMMDINTLNADDQPAIIADVAHELGADQFWAPTTPTPTSAWSPAMSSPAARATARAQYMNAAASRPIQRMSYNYNHPSITAADKVTTAPSALHTKITRPGPFEPPTPSAIASRVAASAAAARKSQRERKHHATPDRFTPPASPAANPDRDSQPARYQPAFEQQTRPARASFSFFQPRVDDAEYDDNDGGGGGGPGDTSFAREQTHFHPITDAALASFCNAKPSLTPLPAIGPNLRPLQPLFPRPSFTNFPDHLAQHEQNDPSANGSEHCTASMNHGNPNNRAPRQRPDYGNLSSDAAFRESVLDALADPDGAAYWQGVFGVDLSTIPRGRIDATSGRFVPSTDDDLVRHARRMIFDAQNADVIRGQAERRKKTEEDRAKRRKKAEERREKHIREAQAAEAERRREHKERVRKAAFERDLQDNIDRSLRRAEERRRRKNIIDRYTKVWAEWNGTQATIAWPSASGKRSDVTEKGVRSFLRHGLELDAVGKEEAMKRMKEQRVRWHPDKMQQKMGGRNSVDQAVMADITMTFQVIDTLYDEIRQGKKI